MRAAPAVTTLLVAVPLLLVLHRRRRAVLALARARQAVVGGGVVLTCAAVVFGVDAAAGGTRVNAVDVPMLLVFLLTNTALALALEAVPEELALRGGAFGVLASRWSAGVAAVGATALFVAAPAAAIALTWAVGSLLGLRVPPPSLAPGGQDPLIYAVVLVLFGSMLVLARLVTGSVWACVGAHLVFLTVNRVLAPGSGFDTGVSVTSPPGAELLVLVYLVLSVVVFAAFIRRNRRNGRQQLRWDEGNEDEVAI